MVATHTGDKVSLKLVLQC